MIERGKEVGKRKEDINNFFKTGKLLVNSNVQFGEGGAGTFSDGKLTTGVKDKRKQFILETFVQHGANEDILYMNKPHVGTDYLINVVKSMREKIIENVKTDLQGLIQATADFIVKINGNFEDTDQRCAEQIKGEVK